jgi:HSP20 family molecular chaperone IbpA
MATKDKTALDLMSKEFELDTRRWFDPFTWPVMNRWFDNFPGLTLSQEFRIEENVENGIDPDADVELSVREGTLVVKAERRQETKTDGEKGWHRSEFRYGSFSRTIPLPRGVTADDVKATYVDGILEVRMPYPSSEPEARKIAVTRG